MTSVTLGEAFSIVVQVAIGLFFLSWVIVIFLDPSAKRKKKAKSSDFDSLSQVYLNLSSRIHTLYDAERRLQVSVNSLGMDVVGLQEQIKILELRLDQIAPSMSSAPPFQVEVVTSSVKTRGETPSPDLTIVPPSLRQLEMD